jgi:hypothetical protein
MLSNFIAGAIIVGIVILIVRLVKARGANAGRHEPPDLP